MKTPASRYVDILTVDGQVDRERETDREHQDGLTFSCKCSDGSEADLESYMNTIPYFVCQSNFASCIKDHPDDADGQDQCKQDNQCGSKNATESSSSASGSSSSSSASSASSTSSSMPSSVDSVASGASTSPTSTPNAALIQDHSTGLMAVVLFVAAQMVL